MNFQWYPGHMTKAKRMMMEDIKLIDLVIELVDARVPVSSKNPDIDRLAQGKSRIILLNKYDLADREANEKWKQYYEEKGFFVALVNSKTGAGLKEVGTIIQKACQAKIERDRKRGIKNRPVRAMIVGIPNVGKSTFINSYAGKACTKTGNKPGVTKGKQWIRLNKHVELLDTPGILWPKFEDQSVGMKLAFIGSIKEELLQRIDLCLELLCFLKESYPDVLSKEYQIKTIDDNVKMLENIAIMRGCKKKGDEPDLEKAAALVLENFRNGKLGKITLELP